MRSFERWGVSYGNDTTFLLHIVENEVFYANRTFYIHNTSMLS